MLGAVRGVPPPAWIGSAGAAACTISHVEMPAFSATQPKMKPPRTCLARGNVSDSHPNPRKNITILSGSPEFRVSRSAHTSILCSTTRADSRSSSVRSERTAVLIVSGLSPDVTTPDIRHAFAPYAAVQVRHFFSFFFVAENNNSAQRSDTYLRRPGCAVDQGACTTREIRRKVNFCVCRFRFARSGSLCLLTDARTVHTGKPCAH